MASLPVEVSIEQTDGQITVHFGGRLSGHLSEEMQEQIRSYFRAGGSIQLDFSKVEHLTSGVLRRMLLLARYGRSIGCRFSVCGVPAELIGMVEAAGFLPLFARLHTDEHVPVLTVGVQNRIDAYPTAIIDGYGVRRGDVLPFGATLVPRGVNFSLFARHAESVVLQLYRAEDREPFAEIGVPHEYRIGDIWAIMVFDLDIDDLEYSYRVDGKWAPHTGHRYDPSIPLLDPYAQSITGCEVWGQRPKGQGRRALRGRIVPHDFDWNGDRALELPVEDLVIYELHVRGFTASPTSGVQFPGTFAGLREKIPYLIELGINCVELMPIFEFDECENRRWNPETGELLVNYWGYSTIGFCAPKAGFAATSSLGMQSDELKTLIRDLHTAGIEVILDVVFNHTAELDENGPTLSFRGLDNRVYYLLSQNGEYLNFSGCGNTFNCNHPVVRDFVITCLRHWVTEYHVDGFRFDLASILGRDTEGNPLANPPLLESLARDPILSRTKLIAEAWDAGGLYQVGSFPSFGRWMEWNGRFRDASRRFLKGDVSQTGEMAQRLIGSPDLYSERGPSASVNFVTCHDGFTLADLVSYNTKHNLANGEENTDGSDQNDAWNCGVEGPTSDPAIQELRLRQSKNALALLFLSQGIPMLLMGDEVGRTQYGNNNAYCHDGPLTWLDWSLIKTNSDLFRFCRELIAFRKHHPALRHDAHAGIRTPTGFPGSTTVIDEADPEILEVTWHGVLPHQPDWSASSHSLAVMLQLFAPDGLVDVLYLVFNMFWEDLVFQLPAAPEGWAWSRQINTASPSPADISVKTPVQFLGSEVLTRVVSRSVQVFVGHQNVEITPETPSAIT